MRNLRQIFVALLLLFVGATAMAQSQSDNTDGNTTTIVRADVNGDGVVNEADIAEIIAIMKNAGGIAEQPKYYWYEGWRKPTSSNIATLVSNADGVASRGAVVTSLDATELVKSTETIRNSSKANIYVVIPTGYKIYDITLGIDVTNTSFTEVTDELIPNHKVYTFNDPTRISTSIYIRK